MFWRGTCHCHECLRPRRNVSPLRTVFRASR